MIQGDLTTSHSPSPKKRKEQVAKHPKPQKDLKNLKPDGLKNRVAEHSVGLGFKV